jgi:TrfA protein
MSEPKPVDPELAEIIARFGATIAKAEAENPRPPEPKPPAKIYQLPLWPKAAPGAPNPVLRSALFAAIKSKDRRFLNNEPIASVDGQQIKFKGEQLNQEDLEVWLEVLELAREHPLGDRCHTSAYGLLKALRKTTGNHDHQQLDACLTRLVQPVTVTPRPLHLHRRVDNPNLQRRTLASVRPRSV